MDPHERLDAGEQAAREHRYDEALNHYIWFHEHALEHNEALYGVRLSFALASWAELGEMYPPALSMLKGIRDRKTAQLLLGEGDRHLFNDVSAINDHLHDQEATYQLFVSLNRKFPDLAKSCASTAMPVLVQKRDYALARRFIQKPEEAIRSWSAALNKDLTDLDQKPPSHAPVRDAYIRIYIDHVREILETLSGTGETGEAAKLSQLAVDGLSARDARESVEVSLARLPLR